jgi:hypothetical protein
MPSDSWLGELKLRDCTLTVRKRGNDLVVNVESAMHVTLTTGRDVAVGDMVKIHIEEANEIVSDDDDCASIKNSYGYGLVTGVDADAETISGLWVYSKSELPAGAGRVLGSSEAVLTTDAFKTPVSWDSIAATETPEDLHPRVMLFGTKKLDARMTTETLSAILTTAGYQSDGVKRRRRGSMFDLPGHASQYKDAYDAANATTQAKMASLAALLYTLPDDSDWDTRINELNVFAQRLALSALQCE